MTHSRSIHETKTDDPKTAAPKPAFEQEKIPHPGSESEMNPEPDHGETSYQGFNRLKDRVALVTGADSGIGRAVALAFAREGADVALSYLKDEQRDGKESARWVEKAGRRALQIPGDLQDEKHCADMVRRVHDQFGKLDIVINNAGFQSTHESIEEFSTEEFDRTYKTNIYAMFWICRAALPLMKEGAAIINTASIQAFDPSPNLLAYASTKAAIVNFTKGLAKTAMKRGVRVNAVAPGPVWTPLIPATMPEEKVKTFGKNTVFERPAQPVELSPLFVFLASNEARFVTGEVYGATGGQTPF